MTSNRLGCLSHYVFYSRSSYYCRAFVEFHLSTPLGGYQFSLDIHIHTFVCGRHSVEVATVGRYLGFLCAFKVPLNDMAMLPDILRVFSRRSSLLACFQFVSFLFLFSCPLDVYVPPLVDRNKRAQS